MEERECVVCGTPFTPTRSNQMCCCRRCRNKYTNFKKDRHCIVCGKVYHDYSSTQFCSEECKHEYKMNTLSVHEKVCPVCGTPFKGFSFQIYCSEKCKAKHVREEHRVEAICEYCGNPYTKYEYIEAGYKKAGKEYHSFCSHSCCMAWEYENGIVTAKYSSQHEKINKLLDSMRIPYLNEVAMGKYFLDIELVGTNKAIEIMGAYWHGEVRRYPEIQMLAERQSNCVEKDKRKLNKANELGIEILYLWEYDIDNDLDLCKKLINAFINDELDNKHSSHYILENYDILKENNIKQYMEL